MLDKKDTHFQNFRAFLEKRRKECFSEGIGAEIKQADPLTRADEERLWESGVFNTTTAQGYIVYFYNMKLFGFRCKDEHDYIL